jgi:hypothetical protein
MADGYEKQADRLHGVETPLPEARNGMPPTGK